MIEGLERITTAALGLALDAAGLRQQAIAANIANANAVGFIPLRVNFEEQLQDVRLSLQSQGKIDAASLDGISPRLEEVTIPNALGIAPKVMLDVEVAHLAQNSVHYQALIKGLSKHFAILSSAVNDGKK